MARSLFDVGKWLGVVASVVGKLSQVNACLTCRETLGPPRFDCHLWNAYVRYLVFGTLVASDD